MVSRSRPCLAVRLTTLLAIPYSSCHSLCRIPSVTTRHYRYMRSGASSSTAPDFTLLCSLATATQRAAALRHARVYSTSRTALGARAPMVGPAPPPAPPAAPIFDKDGKELAKATKRKVAIVVGYVGTKFHGWQQSTDMDVRTVEGVLETALWKSGAIADSNYGDLRKIGWGRTSRTDKGVHASKTVAAAKLLYPQETFNEAGLSQYAKDSLNDHLPEDVRCFSVSKVPKSFRGRDECTLREYSYYLPKHLLPAESTEKLKSLLNEFVGTHSFHNFASMKGRGIKEVMKRVQDSIDKRSAQGGGQAAESEGRGGGGGSDAVVPESGDLGEGDRNEEQEAESTGKRSVDWRTWRYKKKSAVEQEDEDAWYQKGKPSRKTNEAKPTENHADEGADTPAVAGNMAANTAGSVGVAARDGVDVDAADNAAEPVTVKGVLTATGATAGDETENAAETFAVGEGETVDGDDGDGGGQTVAAEGAGKDEEGPVKVLMLRELRTSIYRCEVVDGVVKVQRDGEESPDEFIRIDIRGKAFVYNQIRLIIGGALCEARGELFPGFVRSALNAPYRLRVPLAPAEGLVLESQAFTRHANALVLDPRDLKSVAGTLTRWMNGEGGNAMQTDGRVQTLLSTEQLAECDRWRDEHIVPAVADAWATKGAAGAFLDAVEKFFVGQQQGEALLSAIKEHMDKVAETERAAEEKHNRHRLESKEKGSTKYKDLLPKNIATQIVCRFRLLPGNKVSAIQRGVAKSMGEGKLPALADNDEVLHFIEQIGVDELAIAGGFSRADIINL